MVETANQVYTLANLPEILVGGVVITAMISFLRALFLQVAAKAAGGVRLPYKPAYFISFIVGLIDMMLVILFSFLSDSYSTPMRWIIEFLIGAVVYGRIIRDAQAQAVGVQKGSLISFFMCIVGVALMMLLRLIK